MSRSSTSFHFMPLSYFLSSHGEDVTQRMLDSFEPGIDIYVGIGISIESEFSVHKENVTFPVREF